ncbi:MAG: universal stress protein [Halobacteriales archaeon]|nr:universal stress protein [Halobacteriales archaeon]
MYDDILVPTDGSEEVQQSIDHGIDLACLTDATLHGLFVVDTADAAVLPEAQWVTIEETLEETGDRALADIEASAMQREVETRTAMRYGNPHEEISSYAEEKDVDLIIMGSRGRSGLDRVLLGSVTENVIRQTDKPVLVQRLEDTG